MASRTRSAVRLLAASVLALASLTVMPAPAWAAGLTGSLSPSAVTPGATNTTIKMTLSSPKSALIGQFTVTVPDDFSNITADKAQGGVQAIATVKKDEKTGDTIVTVTGLAASTVSVEITTTTPTVVGGYIWEASASDTVLVELGSTDLTMTVGESVVPCKPDNTTPCDSGVITSNDPTAGVTTKARVVADPAGTADLLVSYLNGESRPCGTSTVGATLTYDVANRPATISYTLAADSHASNNTVPPLNRGVCFESTVEFAGSQSDPARPGFYYGNLSKCGTPVIRPCQSGTKTQSNPLHTVTVTVLAPGGDPKIGP